MQLAHYLGLLHRSQDELGKAFHEIAEGHREEPDVFHICEFLARQCEEHSRELEPFVQRYSEEAPEEPERLHSELFQGIRSGGLGLLRDLQDLYLMAAAIRGPRRHPTPAVTRPPPPSDNDHVKWVRGAFAMRMHPVKPPCAWLT